LIGGISAAIGSSGAIRIYVCNIMTQPGETDSYRVSDHIKTLSSHSHPGVFDYCITNIGEIPASVLKRYAQENSYPVVNDTKNIENMGYRVIEEDVVRIEDGVIRHDPDKLARIIFGLAEEF
jgi:uncharacterized cofD-like protein